MPPLEEYRAKRDFGHTPEPAGGRSPETEAPLSFVVQKHAARALHYDFRLELDGVLMSWAVPKGPSLDPRDKRLAVHVEDHPLDYGGFEGTIPAGEYGGGSVIVWDRGTWQPLGDPHAGLAKGDFKFTLDGTKLRGLWVLVRLKPRPGEKRDSWLLIKEKDEFTRPREGYDLLAEEPLSVLSGVPIERVGEVGDGEAIGGGRVLDADDGDLPGQGSASPHADGLAVPDPRAAAGVAPRPAAGPDMLSAAAGAGPSPGPFPTTIDVELATLVAQAPEGDGWLSEVKYDGYRLVLALDGGRARALTRSHADWTDRFSPLAAAAEALPASSAILDGEAIVFDEAGVSRFELLQKALGEHPERLAFAAFDLLYLNGYDLRELPLLKRKELLAELLTGQPETFPLHFADHLTSGSAEFYRRACVSDLEGIVCKLAGSRYTPGRGRDWQKVKCRQTQEFVVGGFTEGAGSRSALGSLLIGHYEGDVLVYAGRVGSGLDAAAVTALRSKLEEIERDSSPFDPPPHITGHVVHWAQPTLVVQVAFREWTSEGVLRQPVYLGIREDKAAEEVVREAPGEGSAPGGDSDDAGDPGAGDPPSGDAVTPGARDAGSPVEVLGVKVTNPDKLLFPESGFTKLDFARYYKAIAPLMLSEVADRPLTLVRCPVGRGRGCFYQRHPDAGLPAQVRRLPYTLKSEAVELLYVDSADGLVALAQMGAAEIHTWLSHTDAPARPDRLCFDLDPGPDVSWPQIRATALLVREECSALGFSPFVKSTGSKGLHVVIPIEPVWEFDRIRALAKLIAERIASRHPESLTSKMAKNVRGGRVFFDYLRNAEGASAVAPYSTRMKPGPSCAVPLGWDELAEDLDIRGFTPARVLERMSAGVDPWRDMGDSAVGVRVLRKAEESVGGV